MKTLKKLKLSQLSDTEMKEREMNMLKGGNWFTGYDCSCGCLYENSGGATESKNEDANISKNATSTGYGKCDTPILAWFTVDNYGK